MNEKIISLIVVGCVAAGGCDKIVEKLQEEQHKQAVQKCSQLEPVLPDPYDPKFLRKLCCYKIPVGEGVIPVKSTDHPIPHKLYCVDGGAVRMDIENEQGGITSIIRMNDGMLNGVQEGWHDAGQKQYEEFYAADKRQGKSVTWYSDGQKESEEDWKDGELDGKKLRWHENGKLWEVEEWKKGERHGEYKLYDRKGNLFKTVKWKDGVRVDEIQHAETFQF